MARTEADGEHDKKRATQALKTEGRRGLKIPRYFKGEGGDGNSRKGGRKKKKKKGKTYGKAKERTSITVYSKKECRGRLKKNANHL